MQEVKEQIDLGDGNTLYVIQHDLGIRYVSDEIEGGMVVFDDSTIRLGTIEKVVEHYNSIPDEEDDN